MKIFPQNDGSYRVESDSGNIYTVSHYSPDYEEDVHVWSCSCKGYKYRGTCKHVEAVIDFSIAEEQERGW